MSDHEDYQGLAAGYALHALEPEDEQTLAAHLLTCTECARLVADAATMGSALADLVHEPAPSAGLRDRILAAAAAEPRREPMGLAPVGGLPPSVHQPRSGMRDRTHRSRKLQLRSRVAVGVLAAVVGVGIAVPVTLAASGGSKSGNSAFAQALLEPGAREVTLTGKSGTSAAAKAAVNAGGVQLVADRLPKNDTSNSIYVLWMAGATGPAAAVATFDVRSTGTVAVDVSKLPMPASQIKYIAVSKESGRKAPGRPTSILIKGTAV